MDLQRRGDEDMLGERSRTESSRRARCAIIASRMQPASSAAAIRAQRRRGLAACRSPQPSARSASSVASQTASAGEAAAIERRHAEFARAARARRRPAARAAAVRPASRAARRDQAGKEGQIGRRVVARGKRRKRAARASKEVARIGQRAKGGADDFADRDRIMPRRADLGHRSPHEPHGSRGTLPG